MCLSNCSQCKYFTKPQHSGDIVCSLNPAYASMWQRLKTLDEYTLNSIPVDNCREFELNPNLELKTIPLSLSFKSWQILARESSNPIIKEALADLLIHLELCLTVEQWRSLANANIDSRIRVALEESGIEALSDSWINVDSSAISAISYTRSSSTLKIRFDRGDVYQYDCIPHQLYLNLLDAGSKGRFFNAYIKDVFPYRPI